MLRLNLGSGSVPLEGYENLDGKYGDSIYPLNVEDGSCGEIRASHVLEHFSHHEVMDILRHWVSKLAPGGLLKIAVPDMEKIARAYLEGEAINVQGYIYGGQVDERDFHKCGFDAEVLLEMLLDAGLERVHDWSSSGDCAALPISLNLAGYRPISKLRVCKNTTAVLSAPRFGPVLHFRCAASAFGKASVPYQILSGAYWHQVLSEVIETQLLNDQTKYIITCDYDTVFSYVDVLELYRLMEALPDADAIFPMQSKRCSDFALFGIKDKGGKPVTSLPVYQLSRNVLPVASGHFGLTIFRADRLRELERPWMNSYPNEDGRWGEGKQDADIHFWKNWLDKGNTLYLAPRIVVGHMQEMIAWPGQDLKPIYQTTVDYDNGGMPEGARR
jgi:hypothetical protein